MGRLSAVGSALAGIYLQWSRADPQNASNDLAGTSWQVVKFEGSDEKTLTPDDKTKYTLTFEADGRECEWIATVGSERGNLQGRINSSLVRLRSRGRCARRHR